MYAPPTPAAASASDIDTPAPTDPQTYELALPLPRTADTTLYIQLTVAGRHILVFLSTRSSGTVPVPLGVPSSAGSTQDGGETLVNPMRVGDTAVPVGKVSLGSFVYAMPSMGNERGTVCTPLIPEMATLETAERIARLLARRVRRPVYLGCSISLAAMGGGGSVEEEMTVIGSIVKVVAERVGG
ncbi:hypothetical protein TWF696_004928 [Orbilia brochopaga]|uniref:Proteasome assembly chaperone 3 n=1 Tax=Orbilia brochopaga TaxID=3140254 RepID=A0AAV9V356_9PEZI